MRTPLVLGVAATTGVALGVALGPFLIGWGLVVACAVAGGVFAVGLARDAGDTSLRGALLGLGMLTLGFVASSVPVTLDGLSRLNPRFALELLDPLDVQTAEEARAILVWRWVALGAIGIGSLVAAWRWRR